MNKSIFFLFSILVILFLACASEQQPDTNSTEDEDILPGWVVSPRTSDIGFFGIGYAKKENEELSIESALKNARADISKQVYKKIKAVVVKYAGETGIDIDNKELRNFYDTLSQDITNKYLIKVERTNLYQDAEKGVWLEVLYNKSDFINGIKAAVNSIEVKISGFDKEEAVKRF